MTIRKFAYQVQSGLRQAHGIDLRRSHVHEVLAALFGFASYAALTTQRVLAQEDGRGSTASLDVAGAAARALDLGYTPPTPPLIAMATARAAEAERLCVVTLDAVLAELGVENGSEEPSGRADAFPDTQGDADDGHGNALDDDWDLQDDDAMLWVDLDSAILRESLLRMAEAGSASAHLALARLDEAFLEDARGPDGHYWFEQQQSGRLLTGVEAEWAETYRRRQEAHTSREEHFRSAAALGSLEAALRQARVHPSDESFALAVRIAGDRHPAQLGDLAMSCGREDDARHWLRAAARQGDTDAMKTLASELESDLRDAWTWVYLAELLGVDVMAYHAVGDDGLPADADEAGPLYAAGGFDLDSLPAAEDTSARERARDLYAAIN